MSFWFKLIICSKNNIANLIENYQKLHQSYIMCSNNFFQFSVLVLFVVKYISQCALQHLNQRSKINKNYCFSTTIWDYGNEVNDDIVVVVKFYTSLFIVIIFFFCCIMLSKTTTVLFVRTKCDTTLL